VLADGVEPFGRGPATTLPVLDEMDFGAPTDTLRPKPITFRSNNSLAVSRPLHSAGFAASILPLVNPCCAMIA
jgi:hypothetical protein